jgi:endonuclease YncB( thermonuclease family)
VSKHWKPGKQVIALDGAPQPSRIRREPVQLRPDVPTKPQRPLNYRERELYLGIAGILAFAALIAVGIIGFAIFTVVRADPAAEARARQFSQCYNAQGPNCVLDGGTIYADGQRVEIAGIDAPKILEARCDREHDRGVEAASQLALLLNSGPVSIGAPFRDSTTGREVRKVEVRGRDVALKMVGADRVHEVNSGLDWCPSRS